MAQITGRTEEKIFRILQWKGLNENPDGDSKLDLGESPVMRNWKVTKDGNLQRRPGVDKIVGLPDYTLSIQSDETAKTDVHVCSQLRMYPSVHATEKGFIEPDGEQEIVTKDNWRNYTGYYWIKNKYYTWKFMSLSYRQENDTYLWTMRRVKAINDSASLYVNDSVTGLWAGNVNGTEYLVAAFWGDLYKIYDSSYLFPWVKERIGSLDDGMHEGQQYAHMFGYSNKLYILGYGSYKEWDGVTLKNVEGYRPLVSVSIAGTSGGTLLEQVNKLNGYRRVWISPDGTATLFALPENGLSSVDYVKDRTTGEIIPSAEYSVNLEAGTVTFTTAPVAAVNSYEIGYTFPTADRGKIENMMFSELFNGANDNRVFFYGDGTNQAIYSGLDYDGKPRADYFPDMNVLVVGEANTPITGMIRHYSRLMVYKTDSAYSVQYSVETLADGTVTPTYYVTPVNRDIGNHAPGQVCLVDNSPFTLHGKSLYEWKNMSAYSSNLSIDERQAKRISDRIIGTLASFDFRKCYCFDDNTNKEYYICCDGAALVYNYVSDAWYYYDHFNVVCMCSFHGSLYLGDDAGEIHKLDYENRSDNGEAIPCYWESGSMSFDREWMRKYSAMLWVGIKPEGKGQVTVTVQTDRKSVYTEKLVASGFATFASADFRHWSFNTNRLPHEKREKIKAKKFVFYKLLFELEDTDKTATILNADLRVRYTGYAR